MKRKNFSLILVLAVLIPLSIILSACSLGTVTYVSYMPTIYEAELFEKKSDDNTYTYSVIKRYETIGDQEYYVFYGKYETTVTNTVEEWFCVWNETDAQWDSYLWSVENEQWVKSAIGTTFGEVTRVATYFSSGVGVKLKKTDLVRETDDFLEYNWGGIYADCLRVSKNKYRICLYHGYNDKGVFTSYEKFTKFSYDESTTAIPHFDKFSFID